jgi:hypothetical protein
MGSTGPGHFSDYPGNGNAIKGVTGGESGVNECERGVMTRLEDVSTSDYYQKTGNVPPIGTSVIIAFATRIVAIDDKGVIIGNLPTEYNYLMRCLREGYQYEGEVIGSNTMPLPSVQIAVTPQKI